MTAPACSCNSQYALAADPDQEDAFARGAVLDDCDATVLEFLASSRRSPVSAMNKTQLWTCSAFQQYTLLMRLLRVGAVELLVLFRAEPVAAQRGLRWFSVMRPYSFTNCSSA